MAFYTVLTPPPKRGGEIRSGGPSEAMEQAVFLKDGFAVYAFLFTGLWLLAKRLWLAFLVFLLLWGGLLLAGSQLGFNPLAIGLAQTVIGLYLGLEGNALVEGKLIRKGWTLAGVVEGKQLDTIERRFFEQAGLEPARAPVPAPSGTSMTAYPQAGAGPAVVGLFPDPPRGR